MGFSEQGPIGRTPKGFDTGTLGLTQSPYQGPVCSSRLEDRIAEAIEAGLHTAAAAASPPPPSSTSSAGPASPSSPGTITLNQAQDMALRISTYFEGGKSMNYAALADDFDGQGTSFGLIQWNFGQNTLGPLLNKMRAKGEAAFAACFGKDAGYETLKTALTAGDKAAQLKWARDLLKSNRAAWSAAFKNIGANPIFNQIQHDEAIAHYSPLAVKAITALRGMSPKLLAAIEFRSYAALFDLCVQQNGIGKVSDEIQQRIADEKPQTQLDVLKIAVTERAQAASDPWVSDCVSRRMGILTAGAYESTENDITKKRDNPQFALVVASGTSIVIGL
jgi:hypothetical protein